MDFLEACKALYSGHKIRKTSWASNDYLHFKNDCIVTNTDNPWTRPFIGFYSNDDVWELYREPLKIVLDEQVILKKDGKDIVLGEISDLKVIKKDLINSLNQVSELVLNGEQIARTVNDPPKYFTTYSPTKSYIKTTEENFEIFSFVDNNDNSCSCKVGKVYRFLYQEKGLVDTWREREAKVTGWNGEYPAKIYAELTKNDSKYHNQKEKGRTFCDYKIMNWEEA